MTPAELKLIEKLQVNHEEALAVAWLKRDTSNLARSYLVLLAELERLRNILNEEGLTDPGLREVAGKGTNIFDLAVTPQRKFKPPGETR